MNEFFSSVKADLTDRRMRPLVAVVAIALLGAVAYTVLGGGGESSTGPASATTGGPAGPTPSLTGASTTNPKAAASETTYGTTYRHGSGKLVDPFTELKAKHKKSTVKAASAGSASSPKTTSTAGSSGSSGSSGSGGSSGGSGGSTPPPPSKPVQRTVYVVDVEFGKAPTAAGEKPHLVSFKDIKVGKPVPSANDSLATLKSASLDTKALSEGKTKASATFALSTSRAPIVEGPGQCLPSETQCESLKLQLGQTEELEYLEPSGETVTYLLKLSGVFANTETVR